MYYISLHLEHNHNHNKMPANYRPATAEDFELMYNLYFHPDINPFLLYDPMERPEFVPIFNALLEQKVLYIFEYEGQAAGMFKLIPLAHRTAHIAYVGGVAMSPTYAGKGLGKRLMGAIIDLARTLGLRRLELSTATTNERAIRLYQSVGFEAEGVLRQYSWLRPQNEFLDEVMMSLLLQPEDPNQIKFQKK